MSVDTPDFRDFSLQKIPVKQIVEVDKEARQRYAEYFAKPPAVYAERLSRDEIKRLLVVMPITVVQIDRRNKSDNDQGPQYRVIAGLRTWSVVQLDPGLRQIPCLLIRNSQQLRDAINKTELITGQGLMRTEASDLDWVRAHNAIVGTDPSGNTAESPALGLKELATMLGRTEQSIKNWLKKPVTGKKGKGGK